LGPPGVETGLKKTPRNFLDLPLGLKVGKNPVGHFTGKITLKIPRGGEDFWCPTLSRDLWWGKSL